MNQDEPATADLVKQNLPAAFNLCLHLCQNQAAAEDLCQEAMVRALRSLPSKTKSSFFVGSVRSVLDLWKSRPRPERKRAKTGASGSPPDKNYQTLIQQHPVLKALANLDDNEKVLVVLRDMNRRSHEEIADIFETGTRSVTSRLAQARERLREERRRASQSA